MKQGTQVAHRNGIGSETGTGGAGEAPESRAEALKAIREMLSEVAEDALRLGILDCIPLIAAADLAIDDALGRGG